MNARDPLFTARLESALHILAKQPTRPLAYLTSRFGLASGDLALWLAEFNGGKKELKPERIEEVKRELGGVTVTKVAPRMVGPLALGDSARAQTKAPPPPPPVKRVAAPAGDIGRWLEDQRVKVTGRVNSFLVDVTPETAAAWLAFNDHNRRPSQAKIRRFAASMAAGRWTVNGETVKFSLAGRLLDGQSRLMAVLLAKVPVTLEVRAGLPDKAQDTMDVGEIRKGAHTLEMRGEASPLILAPALKYCWLWDQGAFATGKRGERKVMENADVAPTLEKHPGLKASVGWAVTTKCDRFLPRSEAAFWHYQLGRADAKLRDQFWAGVLEGLGLTKFSPVYHLREKLLELRTNSSLSLVRTQRANRGALVAKAWNMVVQGTRCEGLAWNPKSEEFPKLERRKQ